MSEQRRSVFGAVDQEEMVKRLEQAPDGDIEAMLPQATSANPAVLAGIEAFVDSTAAPAGADASEPPEFAPQPTRIAGAVAPKVPAVEFRGRLVDDLAASRSFVLYGPAGVRRLS